MTRAGGGLGAWGSLVLLGLCAWTGARTAGEGSTLSPLPTRSLSAPGPVRNLTVWSRTSSSISLCWAPPDTQSYTYWVQYPGDGKNETRNTTDVTYTAEGLAPASLYAFSVWVEGGGASSHPTTLTASSAPNPVRDLTVESRTNSSITLRWEPPDNQNYTYWVQYPGDGKNETRNTTDVTYTVEGLTSATSYPFSVWAERHGVPSAAQTQEGSTAPNPVGILTMESRTTSSLSLRWGPSHGPDRNYTYWVQWTGGGGETGTRSTADTRVTVDGLKPGSAYELAVWVENRHISGSRTPLHAATVPNAVTSLRIRGRNTSSITLSWAAPQGPDQPPYTYWVSWTLEGGAAAGPQSTLDTTITVSALEAGSLYTFTVWAERNGVNSSKETLMGVTAPNEVTALQTTTQTNNSITLQWEAPADPRAQLYVYCVLWANGGDSQREAGPQGNQVYRIAWTNVPWYVVEDLEPGTPYNFSVWAERSAVAGSTQRLRASTAPNPVRNLTVESRITSSIALSWIAPQGPNQPPYTYWVSWTLEGGAAAGPQNTPDTRITVSAMEAGSLYTFTVWAERNGVNSSKETLLGATAPNEVTALRTTTQTNTSIALQWEAPANRRAQLYVYCVQWAGGGDHQRDADLQGHQVDQIARTNETWYVVEALEPGTPYNFSVWVEKNNVASSTQRLRASTAPDPVTITSCTSISGGYGLTLTWTCPPGGYEAFELQLGGQRGSWDRASCGRGVSVWDLQPAQSYAASVRTLWDGLRAPAASVTCHTESAGVIAGSIVGVLLFLTLVGLLIFFLRRYIQSRE